MQPDVMMQMLKSLKLHGMAQALGELAAQDSPAYKSASLVLAGLLKAEMAAREVRSLAWSSLHPSAKSGASDRSVVSGKIRRMSVASSAATPASAIRSCQ